MYIQKNTRLVYFDSCVNFPYERIRRKKANGSGQQPESEYHQCGISKVHESRYQFRDFQFCHEVKYGVRKNIKSRASTNNETSPPPPVILKKQIKKKH